MTDSYINYVTTKGISLNNLGLQEKALTRADALHAVSLLREDAIPILGGDVYFIFKSKLELAYANWYSNRNIEEEDSSFLARSLLESLNYIKTFPNKDGREPLFTFVLGKKLL